MQGSAPAGDETPARSALAKRRILIVDDDTTSIDTLRRLLEQEGMRVTLADGLAKAAAQVRKTALDVVLANLSPADGRALLDVLHADTRNAGVPVVARTALVGRPGDLKRALDAGFAAHLTRPVALDKLPTTLAEVLAPAAP